MKKEDPVIKSQVEKSVNSNLTATEKGAGTNKISPVPTPKAGN